MRSCLLVHEALHKSQTHRLPAGASGILFAISDEGALCCSAVVDGL